MLASLENKAPSEKPVYEEPELQPRVRSIGFRDGYDLIKRRSKFLAAIIGAGTLLSIIAALSMAKVYTATSSIVFEPNDTRLYEPILQSQTLQRDRATMETELDVIRSRIFLGTVVDGLNLVNDPSFNPRAAGSAPTPDTGWFGWLPFGGTSTQTAKANPQVTKDASKKPDKKSTKPASGDKSDDRVKDASRGSTAVKPNVPAAQRDQAISRLLSRLSVLRNGESLAMIINVSDNDAQKAAALANDIAERYVDWSTDMKRTATTSVVDFLRKRSNELASKIAEKERDIASFTYANDLAFDPLDDLLRARTDQLNEQLTLARVEEAGAQARLKQIMLLLKKGTDSVGTVLDSEQLRTLRIEQAKLAQSRAQLAAKFGKNHPQVMDVDAELATNKEMIDNEIKRIVFELENNGKVAAARVAQFERELATFEVRRHSRNLAEIRRRKLERDLVTEQKRFDQVVDRLGNLNTVDEEVKASARVASIAAVPEFPSFPQRNFIVACGFVGSSLIAVLLAILLEGMDRTLRSAADVGNILRRSNLATFPVLPRFQKLSSDQLFSHILANPKSDFGPAARALCLSCRPIGDSQLTKTIMITSANRREGRSSIALATGAAASLDGLRTIIIDMDPEGGSLSKLLRFSRPTAVADRTIEGGPIRVSHLPGYPFLEVVSAALTLHRFDKFLISLRKDYDLIILDTPPVLIGEDAKSIVHLIDATVLVAAVGQTKEEDLIEAANRLTRNNGRLLGGVVNLAEPVSATRGSNWSARIIRPKIIPERQAKEWADAS